MGQKQKHVCTLPRVAPDQQMVRYAARAKSAVSEPYCTSNIPQFKHPIPAAWGLNAVLGGAASLRAEPASGSQPGTPGPAASDGVPGSLEDANKAVKASGPDSDSEDAEAKMLGLQANPKKKQRKSDGKAKPKLTKEEVFQVESEKLTRDVLKLSEQLAVYPEVDKNLGYTFGHIERNLNKKLKECKDAGVYSVSSELTQMQSKLALMKDSFKTLSSYIPPSTGVPVKKHRDSFYVIMKKLVQEQPDVFQNYSPVVKQAYAEVHLTTCLAQKQWDEVASELSEAHQVHLASNNEELAEEKSIERGETVVGFFFEDMWVRGTSDMDAVLDKIQEAFITCTTKILDKNPCESLATALSALRQIVSKDAEGASTMDGILDHVMQKRGAPIIRVFWNSEPGKKFLAQAHEANASLQTRATASSHMEDLLNTVWKVGCEDAWVKYTSNAGEDEVRQVMAQVDILISSSATFTDMLRAHRDMDRDQTASKASGIAPIRECSSSP